jgi:hypothetical protein
MSIKYKAIVKGEKEMHGLKFTLSDFMHTKEVIYFLLLKASFDICLAQHLQ